MADTSRSTIKSSGLHKSKDSQSKQQINKSTFLEHIDLLYPERIRKTQFRVFTPVISD